MEVTRLTTNVPTNQSITNIVENMGDTEEDMQQETRYQTGRTLYVQGIYLLFLLFLSLVKSSLLSLQRLSTVGTCWKKSNCNVIDVS